MFQRNVNIELKWACGIRVFFWYSLDSHTKFLKEICLICNQMQSVSMQNKFLIRDLNSKWKRMKSAFKLISIWIRIVIAISSKIAPKSANCDLIVRASNRNEMCKCVDRETVVLAHSHNFLLFKARLLAIGAHQHHIVAALGKKSPSKNSIYRKQTKQTNKQTAERKKNRNGTSRSFFIILNPFERKYRTQ